MPRPDTESCSITEIGQFAADRNLSSDRLNRDELALVQCGAMAAFESCSEWESLRAIGGGVGRGASVNRNMIFDLAKGFAFDLADALAGEADPDADFLKRHGLLAVQPVAHAENL